MIGIRSISTFSDPVTIIAMTVTRTLISCSLGSRTIFLRERRLLTVAHGKYADWMPPALILVVVSLVLLYKLALRPQGKKKGA